MSAVLARMLLRLRLGSPQDLTAEDCRRLDVRAAFQVLGLGFRMILNLQPGVVNKQAFRAQHGLALPQFRRGGELRSLSCRQAGGACHAWCGVR